MFPKIRLLRLGAQTYTRVVKFTTETHIFAIATLRLCFVKELRAKLRTMIHMGMFVKLDSGAWVAVVMLW